MAEEKKTPEVDIDTDGVNEETIELEQQPKTTDPAFEKKEEVDLGYTEIPESSDKKETPNVEREADKSFENERETKLEKSEDDEGLKDYSDKVQKRIKKLTFQVREAERREKSALDYAKGLKQKYESAEKTLDDTDTNYLKEFDARIDAQLDQVKSQLKTAIEAQDADKIMEANTALTKLAVEKEKVSVSLNEKEAKKKEIESKPKEDELTQPQISAKAQEWASDNEWFGTDRVLTSAAMGIHEDLLQQGVATESDEYYNQINKRMREYFPHKFAQAKTEVKETNEKPVQNVASVSRRAGGRKAVKLTKSQVVIAKKLGVPLEEYAKFVKEEA